MEIKWSSIIEVLGRFSLVIMITLGMGIIVEEWAIKESIELPKFLGLLGIFAVSWSLVPIIKYYEELTQKIKGDENA